MEQGASAYQELCFECHGNDGLGAPMTGGTPGALMAPPVAGSPRVQGHRDYVIKTLLHGLTGPVGGQSYAQVMIPMGSQTDEWIAAVGSYVRNSFGNTATFITPSDVARVRAATRNRKTSWTVSELEGTLPMPLETQARWTVTASHNPSAAPAGLTFAGWTSGIPQQAGMWYQVELPEPTLVAEVQLDAAGGGRLGSTGRGGGRGRGAAAAEPQAPPPPPGFPQAYQVQVSLDGKTWGRPVASGAGSPLTIAAFTPVRAKFIRITQTANAAGAPPWVIQNLRVFQAR
jgi:mono/diheme cytochrome c family protein